MRASARRIHIHRRAHGGAPCAVEDEALVRADAVGITSYLCHLGSQRCYSLGFCYRLMPAISRAKELHQGHARAIEGRALQQRLEASERWCIEALDDDGPSTTLGIEVGPEPALDS